MIRNLINFNLQVNFWILNALKIRDDVLTISLQEEFPFNKCEQATIQQLSQINK